MLTLTSNDIRVPLSLLRAPDAFGGAQEGDCQLGTPIIDGDRIVGLSPTTQNGPVRMVIPAPTDPHCHLDKCHTIGRMGAVAGDLATAIAAQLRDKANWTDADIRTRATRGLNEARTAGVGAMRSHVDWGQHPTPPRAWHILRELAEDCTDITLQLCPLTGIELMADADWATPIARAAAKGKAALGAFVQGHEDMQSGILQMFRLAEQHSLPLDFHVDEGLGDLNGLEVIADTALATKFEGPVLCGHAVSLMNRQGSDVDRIADKLARAGIAVCALPTTNLYLQDRRAGTPDRRGITRLRELRTAGVSVLTGSDNVADAFCPMGQFDPMAALHLCALAAHLDPPMAQWLPMITIDARAAMGLPPHYIEDTPLADLRLSDAPDCESLVAGRTPLRHFTESHK